LHGRHVPDRDHSNRYGIMHSAQYHQTRRYGPYARL
jgi:hypothetical protein